MVEVDWLDEADWLDKMDWQDGADWLDEIDIIEDVNPLKVVRRCVELKLDWLTFQTPKWVFEHQPLLQLVKQ